MMVVVVWKDAENGGVMGWWLKRQTAAASRSLRQPACLKEGTARWRKEQDGGCGSVSRWEGHRAGVWHFVCFWLRLWLDAIGLEDILPAGEDECQRGGRGRGGRGARRSLKGIGEVVRVCIRVGARFGETSSGDRSGGLCLICGVRSWIWGRCSRAEVEDWGCSRRVAQDRCLSVLSVKASRHAGGGLEGWGCRNSWGHRTRCTQREKKDVAERARCKNALYRALRGNEMFGDEERRKNEEARTYRIWWLNWGLEKDRFKHSPKNTVAVSDKWTEKVDCPKKIVLSSKLLYRRIFTTLSICFKSYARI